MGRQENGGSGGRQENKRWSLIHVPSFLTVLLVISMIHVATSQDKMSTLDKGSNIIGSPRYTKTTGKTNTQSSRVCNTIECINAADDIKSSMNLTVDPCDDFYEYACGMKPLVSQFRRCSSEYITRKLETATLMVNGASKKVLQLPSDLYKSCMNLRVTNRLGAAPLRERIEELGGWNMSGKWNESTWDFKEVHLFIEKTVGGHLPVFWCRIVPDSRNNTKNAIMIEQSGPALEKDLYLDLSSRKILRYRQFIIDVVVLLGGNSKATAKKADEIIRLEAQLANVSLSVRESQEAEYSFNITLEQLQREIPKWNWTDYFNKLLAPYTMPKSDRISVPGTYLKKAMEIIYDAPKSVLANYVVWKVIQNEIYWLSMPFRYVNRKYDRQSNRCLTYKDVSETCKDDSTDHFKEIITAACVHDFHAQYAWKTRMGKRIVKETFQAFKENINTLTWLDNATKSEALQKVDAMRVNIGFPDWMVNSTKVAEIYEKFEGLTINSSTYYKNQVAVLALTKQEYLKGYGRPRDDALWELTPFEETGIATLEDNLITLPVAILQPPFLFPNRYLRSYNLGRFGYYVGHEAMHGFSIIGIAYDKDGKRRNWWSKKALQEFNKRVKCFEKQYSKYKIAGIWPVDGVNTAMENIADNDALKILLKAYYNWAKQNPSETWLLPGLNVTNEQLLFIGFAQDHCSSASPTRRYYNSLGESHADPKIRAIGTLANSCEFANAFKCKINSPMNPINKCYLWSNEGSLKEQ